MPLQVNMRLLSKDTAGSIFTISKFGGSQPENKTFDDMKTHAAQSFVS